jgi:hypothetical protein
LKKKPRKFPKLFKTFKSQISFPSHQDSSKVQQRNLQQKQNKNDLEKDFKKRLISRVVRQFF